MVGGVDVPGLGIPVDSVATALAVLIGLGSRPNGVSLPRWMPALAVAGALWIALVSIALGAPDIRRLSHLAIDAIAIIVVAAGRLDRAALGRGLAFGMVLGVAWGTATFKESGYANRLTGIFGDPNTAGLIIIVCAGLAFPTLRKGWSKLVVVGSAVTGVVLTDSRTTLLAACSMIVWLLLSRLRVHPWFALGLLAVAVLWVSNATHEGLGADAFAGRAGSDALRARIDEAALADVATSPWFGHGAGTARTLVDGLTFFYHSSYLSVRTEGGWIAFAFVVGLLVATFATLVKLGSRRIPLYEATLIGIAVCAINLGEVLMTVSSAAAVGVSMQYAAITQFPRAGSAASPSEETQRFRRNGT
ncbi:O-antigen ligase family protein [Sinomonas terrae]|uniref:O-antigen ligase family protein n=1 Tax=Sinomonas terrae TaxID=2908838 RepID=A0ABS9TY90_9MICC|nr:O-antigen ligase family protein [Sinomonas terrae]MCH6469394.1 O-antigen ligase family protein [Sinomonas terrae]